MNSPKQIATLFYIGGIIFLLLAQEPNSYRVILFSNGLMQIFVALLISTLEPTRILGNNIHKEKDLQKEESNEQTTTDISHQHVYDYPVTGLRAVLLPTSTKLSIFLVLWLLMLVFYYLSFQRFLNANNGLSMFYVWEGIN